MPTLLLLFLTFFKIGAFTVGGGYAMLPFIQQEVLANKWVDNETIINFIAVSESTPGPFAINMATFIGFKVGGFFGAFLSTLGVVMPSFLIILFVAKIYDKFKESSLVKAAMTGLKPVVIGLIGAAVLSVAETIFLENGFSFGIFSDPFIYVSLAIFILSLVLSFKKLNPIFIIIISAGIGIATGFIFS